MILPADADGSPTVAGKGRGMVMHVQQRVRVEGAYEAQVKHFAEVVLCHVMPLRLW